MAAKSIIDVEIDPQGHFKAFYEQFQEYESRLGEMPQKYEAFAESISGMTDATLSSAKETRDLVQYLKSAADAQKVFKVETKKSKDELEGMATAAKQLGKELFGIGSFLLKMGALGGGMLLGGAIGGIYGMDKLAGSVVGNQRSARGLGMTTGQYKAFGMDFGRYLDPGITSSIADAQNSFSGRMYLGMATGMGQNELASMDPGAVAAKLSLKAHDWWQNTPASMRTAEALQSTGFMQSGLTLADMRRLGSTSTEDLQSAGSQYAQDQGKLDTSNGSTDKWYELERQIELAGKTIETSLTNRLVELAPSLKTFVDTISKDANDLINNVLTPENMKSLADGIGAVSTYLGSAQFKQDMKDFGSAIGNIVDFLRKAGILHEASPSSPAAAQSAWNQSQPSFVDRLSGKMQGWDGAPPEFAGMEKSRGLPAGLLYAQEMIESGGNIRAISPKGARGPFQFMQGTADQYELKDPFNLHDSGDAASRYDGDMMKKYGGDIRKVLAAYNMGPGALDKDIAKNGGNWESNAPKETRDYINKIVTLMAKNNKNVNINITNSTTAKVAASMNAAPH
jgi:hypothetical protein